jgi:hypothetical protein
VRRLPPPWTIEEANNAASSSVTAQAKRAAISISRRSRARSKVEICALHHIPPSRFVFEKN